MLLNPVETMPHKSVSLKTGGDAQTFYDILNNVGMRHAIRNIDTELKLEEIEGRLVPITINSTQYDNSYVCSPYTAYISYAKEELGLLNNLWLETGLKSVMGLASGALKLAKINQTVSINNWLVSTNLVPEWSPETIEDFTQSLSQRYPDHSLSIRSLNGRTNTKLMQSLQQKGWLLIPARQVYVFDNQHTDWWKRNNTKNDQRLLRKTTLQYVSNEDLFPEDFQAIETCFNQLFIEKHSPYNPQFTAEYFQALHAAGLVNFHCFRSISGHIVGAIGLLTQQDTITSPILGYDTRLPKSLGLYRLLIAVLLKETYESGLRMNLSSGAGPFKRMRGGEPEIEYTAFYVEHLPKKRRWALCQFAKLLNQTAPHLFNKYQI